jgi:hypothetical protein
MKTRRIAAGRYEVSVNNRVFLLEELGKSEGEKKALWHVCEVVNGIRQPAFDSAPTLREAKYWAQVAAGQGKPLVEIL